MSGGGPGPEEREEGRAGAEGGEGELPVFPLPETLPIFPLLGVLLLPRGKLPLNIFEPRYLNMTRDAMAGDRLIGMVQPSDPERPEKPEVYALGCAGRITSFAPTEDGRILITLTGVSRFRIAGELPLFRGYRRVVADWAPFAADRVAETGRVVDRERLVERLRPFFKMHGLAADWEAVAATPDEHLVTLLAMICPFTPGEKQALLEAPDLKERGRLMIALIEMALAEGAAPGEGAVKH